MKIMTMLHSRAVSWRITLLCIGVLCAFAGMANVAAAKPESAPATSDQRVITIYDQGQKRVVLSKEHTVEKTLAQAGVTLASHDRVEPALKSEFADSVATYTVNIYRARPVTIVDGAQRYRVLSPYSTARDIVKDADVDVQDEDILRLERSSNLLADGVGSLLTIERATALTLVLYGESTQVYTQQTTVGEFLEEKDITLAADDTLSVDVSQAITEGMRIEVWRNGVQTITEEQEVDFPVEQIQDVDREVGYREIQTPGVKGKKTVTYEVVMKNGEEVERQEIQSVVTQQPERQVEIVGAKPSFDGDFAAALAKLRSCEGGYNSWNPAGPYYGAYQFDRSTWSGVSSAPYGNATPAEQDAAARALYERRGWQPWPSCGASLPDIYR